MYDDVYNAGVTAAFFTFCMIKLFHAFNVRSSRRSAFYPKGQNRFLLIATVASFALTTAVIYIPGVRDAFGFVPINAPLYFVCIAIGFAIIPVVELKKLIIYLAEKRKKKEIK